MSWGFQRRGLSIPTTHLFFRLAICCSTEEIGVAFMIFFPPTKSMHVQVHSLNNYLQSEAMATSRRIAKAMTRALMVKGSLRLQKVPTAADPVKNSPKISEEPWGLKSWYLWRMWWTDEAWGTSWMCIMEHRCVVPATIYAWRKQKYLPSLINFHVETTWS